MDPVGKQRKIKGDEYNQGFQKLLDAGTPNLGGGFNKKSGKREADFKTAPSKESGWQGVTKGTTKHTYKP